MGWSVYVDPLYINYSVHYRTYTVVIPPHHPLTTSFHQLTHTQSHILIVGGGGVSWTTFRRLIHALKFFYYTVGVQFHTDAYNTSVCVSSETIAYNKSKRKEQDNILDWSSNVKSLKRKLNKTGAMMASLYLRKAQINFVKGNSYDDEVRNVAI
jgi:hypothetical protein